MSKKFIAFLLRSNKTLNIFLITLNALFSSIFFFNILSGNSQLGASYNGVVASITLSYILIFLECIILPIIELSFTHSRKRLDIYFSLPIKHEEIIKTTIIEVILKIIALHIITISPVLIANIFNLNVLMVIVYVITLIIIVSAIVLFVSAICLKTNSTIDTSLVTLGYLCLPILFYLVVVFFYENNIIGVFFEFGNYLLKLFLPVLVGQLAYTNVGYMFNIFNEFDIDWIIIILLLIFSLVMVRNELKNLRAEKAEELSKDILTYPFVILVSTLCLTLMAMFSDMPIVTKVFYILFIYVAYAIMNFVYQRRVIFTKRSMLLFMSVIMLGLLIINTSKATGGFGLNYSFYDCSGIKNLDIYYYVSNGLDYSEDEMYYVQTKSFARNDKIEDLVKENQSKLVKQIGEQEYRYANHSFYNNLFVVYNDSKEYNYSYNGDIKDKEKIFDMFEEIEAYQKAGVCFEFRKTKYNPNTQEDELFVYDNLKDFKEDVLKNIK